MLCKEDELARIQLAFLWQAELVKETLGLDMAEPLMLQLGSHRKALLMQETEDMAHVVDV